MSSPHNEAEPENSKKYREIKGWAIGPMPEESFFERFLPYNTATPPSTPSERAMPRGSTANTSLEAKEPTNTDAYDSIESLAQRKEELYELVVRISCYPNSHMINLSFSALILIPAVTNISHSSARRSIKTQ